MKNTIIFHGTGGSPESYWFPYLKRNLKDRGYRVEVPQLPNPDIADIKDWLPFSLQNFKYDPETILIGHSSSCALILSILEKIDNKIGQAILVSGFIEPLSGDHYPILKECYDWEKIKSNCIDFTFINSDNDPWGCDDKMGRKMLERLGGVLIIPHGQGHMGSEKFGQPYREFPLLLKLIS